LACWAAVRISRPAPTADALPGGSVVGRLSPGAEPEEVPHPIEGGAWPALWLDGAPPRGLLDCAICDGICPALAEKLKAYKVRPASEAPQSFGLDLNFYSKYINVMGIPVLSSDQLCDCVLQKAAWIVHGTISHIKRMPEVLEKMIEQKHRVAIMTMSEHSTDIPEHSDLSPKDYWDKRARGLGGTPYRPASSGSEESVMCQPYHLNGYFGENILLHEFTHGVARTGFKFVDWDGMDWDDYNGKVYDASKKAGLWKNTYAMTSKIEYFAEAVQSWFDTNLQAGACSSDPGHSNGIHNCINTHEELKSYDRQLYDHLAKIFVNDGWRPGQGSSCGCGSAKEVVEGFAELDADGNLADGSTGINPKPGSSTPKPEPTDPEVPLPEEGCLEMTIDSMCDETPGCKWDAKGDVCKVDCKELKSSAACQPHGQCAWNSEAKKCHGCLQHDDSHIHCQSWASGGECEKNPGWMLEHCKLSCVENGHRHCKHWAKKGECHKNPLYMLEHCQSSCSCKQLKG